MCGGEHGPRLRHAKKGRKRSREDPKQPVQIHLAFADGKENIISCENCLQMEERNPARSGEMLTTWA